MQRCVRREYAWVSLLKMIIKKTLPYTFLAIFCVVSMLNTENEIIKGVSHFSMYIAGMQKIIRLGSGGVGMTNIIMISRYF